MRISPIDIRQQQFTRRLRGVDSAEVEAFLEDVAEDLESVLKENALLKEQLSTLEERTRNLADRERIMQETLITTHRVAEDMKAAAKREAQLVLREAELSADKMMEEARAEEAKIRSEILAIKRVRRQLAEDLRATVTRYERMLARDTLTDDGGETPAS
jgi:cell division initiation protein